MIVDVIIPVLNEESSIGIVLKELPKFLLRNIIVCDNGSNDNTVFNAQRENAIVVLEMKKGYGAACLKGLEYVSQLSIPPDIILFIDGDYSDFPEQAIRVLEPILNNNFEMVIGSRVLGKAATGSLTPVQKFGNRLSAYLIKILYRYHFTDLGPFRAIQYNSLLSLQMEDQNFGWTVEMQVKAAKHKLRCIEVPVDYKKRLGKSKVSGTISGSIKAGYKILYTIFKLL